MAGGGGNTQTGTQTQKIEPPDYLKPHLEKATQRFGDAYAGLPPAYFPGETVAPQGEHTKAGFNDVDYTASGQRNLATQMQGALGNVFGSVDVANNPHLKGAVDAAIQPLYQNLTDVIMPSIEDNAIVAGGLGGARQGVAEGQAIDSTQRSAVNTSAMMYGNAYQQALDNILKASIASPQLQAAVAAPTNTLLQTGAQQDAYAQDQVNANVNRFNYSEGIEQSQATDLLSLLMGFPSGGSTTTSEVPSAQGNKVTGAAGGALAGHQIYPGGWGAAIGGGLGYLMS